jgi:hypothetical protein
MSALRTAEPDELALEMEKEIANRRPQLEGFIRNNIASYVTYLFAFAKKYEVQYQEKNGRLVPIGVVQTRKPYLLHKYQSLEQLFAEPEGKFIKRFPKGKKIVVTQKEGFLRMIYSGIDLLVEEIASKWFVRQPEYGIPLANIVYGPQLESTTSMGGILGMILNDKLDPEEAINTLWEYEEFEFLEGSNCSKMKMLGVAKDYSIW